jgi:hypothetical protein
MGCRGHQRCVVRVHRTPITKPTRRYAAGAVGFDVVVVVATGILVTVAILAVAALIAKEAGPRG